jgi:polyisoprenoid-binding protein YceI
MIKTRFVVAATFALMARVAAPASAQEITRVPVSPDSKLWVDGTSNLHAWTCKAEKLDASVDVDAAAAAQLSTAAPKTLKRVLVKVPVKSLKCGHGGMDDNLYKALNADGAPEITYIMASFEAATGDVKDAFTLHTLGTLSIAGKENKVSMDVEATRLADGTVKAKGVLPIKMSDYGIKPPTAIFGRLKTGDEVKISFEITVGAKAIAAALNGGQP